MGGLAGAAPALQAGLGGLQFLSQLLVDAPAMRRALDQQETSQGDAIRGAGGAADLAAGVFNGLGENSRARALGGTVRTAGADGRYGPSDNAGQPTGPTRVRRDQPGPQARGANAPGYHPASDDQYTDVEGYIPAAMREQRANVEAWHTDQQRGGGLEGRVRTSAEETRNRITQNNDQTRQRVRDDGQRIEDDQRNLMQTDVNRAEDMGRQFRDGAIAEQSRLDRNFDSLRTDLMGQIGKGEGGVEAIRGMLERGASSQVLGATTGLQSQKSNALAQFDASWQGPRDQTYLAQRRAMEQQFDGQIRQTQGQVIESNRQIQAQTIQAAEASLNGLRGSLMNDLAGASVSRDQGRVALSGQMDSNMQGVLSSIDSARNRFAGVQNSVFTQNAETDRQANELLNNFEGSAFNTTANAQQVDQTTRTQYMSAMNNISQVEMTMTHQAESEYTGLLTRGAEIAAGFAQLGLGFQFNRSFGAVQIGPYFQGLINNVAAAGQADYNNQALQAQIDAQSGSWLSDLFGAGSSIGSAALSGLGG